MSPRVRWAATRSVFVAVALGGAWWGFRGRWGEIYDALVGVPAPGLAAALGLTCAGLLATAVVWHTILTGFEALLPRTGAASVFFVGQLGKYIPGSVWSIGAQAQAAARHGVAARTTAACSLVFLYVHVVTGVLVASSLALLGTLPLPGGSVPWGLACIGALGALTPWALSRWCRLLAGEEWAISFLTWLRIIGCMGLVWLVYGAGLAALAGGAAHLWLFVGSFAAAYAVGVLVVFAPAGLGAREAALIAFLAPTVGVGVAAAVALMARVVHTVADALMAAGAAWLAREKRGRRAVEPSHGA